MAAAKRSELVGGAVAGKRAGALARAARYQPLRAATAVGALGGGFGCWSPPPFVLEHLLPHRRANPHRRDRHAPYHLWQPAHGAGETMLAVACARAPVVIILSISSAAALPATGGLMTRSSTPRLCQLASPGCPAIAVRFQQQPHLRNGAQPARRHSLSGILYLVDQAAR